MREPTLNPLHRNEAMVVQTAEGPLTCDSNFLAAAMLIFIAKGSGHIESRESDTMIMLLQEYCGVTGATALELLTSAISEFADRPSLGPALAEVARRLPEGDKEDLAYMALRVIAADGRRETAEMEQFRRAVEAVGIPPDVVHRAFDRFFAETMPDAVD